MTEPADGLLENPLDKPGARDNLITNPLDKPDAADPLVDNPLDRDGDPATKDEPAR